ncbi:MAG: CRISPR-associated endonuclease Cas1 [Candidatus Obscuribacterales bacterium]|nr:CRISPR-associated endonuclease Cas1 [Candidatus Obscuribacterales bacterium]
MDITIEEFGVSLGKKSERLLVKRNGKVEQEHALYDVGQITVASRGVSISTDLIEECVERGIQINFLTPGGKPYAKLTSPSLSATVAIRRQQILAFTDKRGRDFAKEIVLAKTKNQMNLIKYLSKYRRVTDPALYSELVSAAGEIEAIRFGVDHIRGSNVDEIRGQLLSVEGRAGEKYWNAIELLLPEDLNFERRTRRGATDAVNVCLNYGYGILYSRVWGGLLLAGLEPFAGFLHVDRPGKPSLVLDMVEEFRQPVVDKAIFGWLNRGGRPVMDDQGLAVETRKEIAARLHEKMESTEAYEGKKHKVRHIMQEQARRLASFLRENRRYEGFVMQW